ncbi:Riboflavin kinase [Trichinella pseudospiralis]|uniref:riboflavin kinase n=2 Tax=Trichinella pseudospiralis TaxID=6337 RepID=A0A0V1JM18_TRIPS|nr:Riboflavin kinase [Trichinella pseudospiralis]KRY85322.1 Riboflavin kinase [Trichinella pseudospiralis]KRZ21409.1 Riboflavin kinase [Trichinella pseudospiralis]KRZ36040.1 Riboflavin kinase [Trichinella pseudospiralis]
MVEEKFEPYFCSGTVVRGLQRGSRQLGCPTANFSDDVVAQLPQQFQAGVYYGFASVDNGEVYEMVISVGQNVQFNDAKKTMEVHILHAFDRDFYGSLLKIVILGYIRPMVTFNSLDQLIEAIQNDISFASGKLKSHEYQLFKKHPYFS